MILLALLLPPTVAGVVPPALHVLDEHDAPQVVAASGVPTIVVPIFARCTVTCPLTAHKLAAAHPEGFRVVLLSFDGHDSAADMLAFRENTGIPRSWMLWRGMDPAATRAFFDALDFHFMKADGSFDHPDESFVFTPGGVWAATLVGSDFSGRELRTALRRALGQSDFFARPETWIVGAAGGLCVALAGVVIAMRRRVRGASAQRAA